jgi:hypothetical protein
MKILTVLKNMLIPAILVAAGIIFLTLAMRARSGGNNQAPGRRQYISIAIGIVLLLFGISLFLFLTARDSPGAAGPPTILGVTIKASHEGGELVYYQEVNFYDEDGNTNAIERNLVDLSDPSQRPYIQIQNGVINDVPEVQMIRSSTTETWHCYGRVYVATLEVSLVDEDGNRSKPVRYTIDCK